MNSSKKRSLVKAIVYRILGSAGTFFIALFFTSEFILAGWISILDLVIKTILYYIYERAWNKINWGKNE